MGRLGTLTNKEADQLSRGLGYVGTAYKIGRRLQMLSLNSSWNPQILMPDARAITWGTDSDLALAWDNSAAALELLPATDNVGALHLGDGTTDMDLKVFMGSTGAHVLFDNSAVRVQYTDTQLYIGTFTGATQGTGYPITATNSKAVWVCCDDVGAAIGSGTMMRGVEARMLLTYTGGNREQEVAALIGKVVSVAGTNRHNMCGVMGSYEVRTSLTVDGQSAATDTWAQAAIIARVGGSSITINANAVLAGVAVMSNLVSGQLTNSAGGVFAAFYAGAWAGATDWAYGLYFEKDKITLGIGMADANTGAFIRTGTYSSAVSKGITLSSSNSRPVTFLFDDAATTLASAVYRGVLSRIYLGVDATGISMFAVRGQIKGFDGCDFGPGVYAGVQGYQELAGDTTVQSGAKWSGVDSSIDIPTSKALTVASGGIAAGFKAELTGSGTATQSSGGILSAFYAEENVGTGQFGYGLYFKAGACLVDIKLQGEDANGLPCIIASGVAANDAAITTQLGADTLYADGSLYLAAVDGGGVLYMKKNDVWTTAGI